MIFLDEIKFVGTKNTFFEKTNIYIGRISNIYISLFKQTFLSLYTGTPILRNPISWMNYETVGYRVRRSPCKIKRATLAIVNHISKSKNKLQQKKNVALYEEKRAFKKKISYLIRAITLKKYVPPEQSVELAFRCNLELIITFLLQHETHIWQDQEKYLIESTKHFIQRSTNHFIVCITTKQNQVGSSLKGSKQAHFN